MRHPRLRLLLLVCAVAVLAITGIWTAGEIALNHAVQRAERELPARGWQIATGGTQATGWPFSAGLAVHGFAIRRADPQDARHPVVTAAASSIVLQASLLHPRRIAVIVDSTLRLQLGQLPELAAWGDRLAIGLPWRVETAHDITLEARALHLTPAAAGPDALITVSNLAGRLHLGPGPALAMSWHASEIGLPRTLPHPLGRVVSRAALTLAFPAGLPRATDANSLARWRDRQGRILIQDVRLNAGGVSLQAAGRARLDPALQPDVDLAVDIGGYRTLLTRLVSGGSIAPGTGRALDAVLGLASEETNTLRSLPVSWRAGVWRIGQIPLFTMQLPAADPASP